VSDPVREAAVLLLVGETESTATTRTENIKHFEYRMVSRLRISGDKPLLPRIRSWRG
jgi:hypothetical protein